MQFDAAAGEAIIIDLGPRTAGMPLCAAHAETRTPPLGWEISDRRTGAGHTVWESPDEPASDAVTERPPKRRPDQPQAKGSSGDTDKSFSFKDKLGDDETPDELDAASPLLSRAFRSATS